MPVWLQNEGAWIALGISALFIVAGVALYAANVAPDMAQGVALARRTLESGAAAAKLRELQAFTHSALAGV